MKKIFKSFFKPIFSPWSDVIGFFAPLVILFIVGIFFPRVLKPVVFLLVGFGSITSLIVKKAAEKDSRGKKLK